MNKFTIGLISGFVGAIVGAAGGYFLCKKHYQDKYYADVKAAIDEEIQHIRAMNSTFDAAEKIAEEVREPLAPNDIPPEDLYATTYHAAIARVRSEMVPVEQDPDACPPPNDDEQFRVGLHEPPRLITQQEFENLSGFWHYSEWDYLLRDGMVLDENDQPVERSDVYLGDALIPLLEVAKDGDEAFVIAPQFGEAVRVNLVDSDYEALFGHEFEGFDDPDPYE